MGINNYYQWEYIGKYIHFDLLLVESEIVLWDEKKSRKNERRFRKVGCIYPWGDFFPSRELTDLKVVFLPF